MASSAHWNGALPRDVYSTSLSTRASSVLAARAALRDAPRQRGHRQQHEPHASLKKQSNEALACCCVRAIVQLAAGRA